MYPAAFEYHAPTSVKDALRLLGKLKDDAKLLAGGHSLIPMMKLRLAQPGHLIDLGKVKGLAGIKEEKAELVIGAMRTHSEVQGSQAGKGTRPGGGGKGGGWVRRPKDQGGERYGDPPRGRGACVARGERRRLHEVPAPGLAL